MNPPLSSKRRILLIAAFVALAAAVYFGFYFGGGPKTPTATPSATSKETPAAKRDVPGAPAAPTPGAPGAPAMPGPSTTVTVEEGDLAIDEVLRSNKEIPAMARDLNALVVRLTGEAQVNASRHLVNLTSDEDYGLIAGLLVDPKTNPQVIEVLFADLMNRNRELQLPLFLNMLRNPQHPQNEQVRNVMTILAGQDFGNDYAAWDKWVVDEMRRLKAESK